MPDVIVRRRFVAGLRNLFGCYAQTVDGWQVYDNAVATGPRLIASRAADGSPVIADAGAWAELQKVLR